MAIRKTVAAQIVSYGSFAILGLGTLFPVIESVVHPYRFFVFAVGIIGVACIPYYVYQAKKAETDDSEE